MNLHVLSEDQVEFYRGNDYLHAQGALPGDLLQLGRKILACWRMTRLPDQSWSITP